MKRLIYILLLLLLFVPTARAQEPKGHRVYLPIVEGEGVDIMSDFKIIVPEATINYCLNPSAEIAGNFAIVGGGAASVTRVTTYQLYGIYSYRVQSAANNEGGSWTLSALSNAIHYVTVRVRGTLPAAWDWSLDNATYNVPVLLEALDANWSLYGFEFPAAQANASTLFYIRQNGAGAGDYFVDGIQVEQKDDYYTTYCDGTRLGCAWVGTAHASYSTRSAVSRAGGRERDLQDDYGLNIGGVIGMGAPPQSVTMDEYALLPGGELNAIKIHPRPLTLTGVLNCTSDNDLDDTRQNLIQVLAPYSYPKDEIGWQPVRLIYTGAAEKRQVSLHYEGGLEGNRLATEPCYWERVAVRFISADSPFWEQAGGVEAAAILGTNDSITVRTVTARFKDTGQWDDLGPPNVAGTYTSIRAFAEEGVYVYIGGDFTNFDNIAAADYIVRYNKQTGAWSALGTGMNSVVYALLVGSDGRIYATGAFTTAGGVAANGIAVWDPSTSTWAALGAGLTGGITPRGLCLAAGLDSKIYVGGVFTTAGGGAASNIASWDPIASAWAALGAGCDNTVGGLTTGQDGRIYATGTFLNAGGAGANYIAVWNPIASTWGTLGTGFNSWGWGIETGLDGRIYVGGAFTTAGGTSANYIAVWNHTTWAALGDGMDNEVWVLKMGPDERLYAGGLFTEAGGITIADRVAVWNKSSWTHLDIDLPGAPYVFAINCGVSDPVVVANYDLWLGFDTAGTAYLAGVSTATNNGVEATYPVIVFSRSGGTTATIETVRNETTGKVLLFDYDLLDGETLTINLDPAEKSIVSSFFGSRSDAILENSDFGEFTLAPGDNQVTSFVTVAGAPTVTAYLTWSDKYK